ncbi:MAG: hypothetical protein K0Q43_921 [Ramlibacter sp.]|nr:hypothetical protein [Ramlibacter sp.]
MSHSLGQQPDFKRSSFVQSCAYCCPECGKGYSTHAALPPLVSLLTKRTDGKNDGYQETMF